MSPATSRRTLLRQIVVVALGLPAASAKATPAAPKADAAANAVLAKYVGK